MPVEYFAREKCIELLSKAVYGRLATCGDNGQPYITPINFVIRDDKIYFHTGFQGRKLDNLSRNPQVCLEISEPGKIYATPHARNFTMRFWSILVFGKASVVEDNNLKLSVMNLLMEKYARDYQYEPLSLDDMDIVNVLEITMDEITGKASIDPV